MWSKCHLCQSVCCFNQSTYTVDTSTYLIHARTEHGSLDFYHVFVSWNNRVNADWIFVSNTEVAHVKLINIKDRILATRLSAYTYWTCIGVTSKSTRITDECSKAFAAFHLIEHWAFYLTANLCKHLVRTHNDDVVISQAHITTQMTSTKEVVYVNRSDECSSSIYLDITQCS